VRAQGLEFVADIVASVLAKSNAECLADQYGVMMTTKRGSECVCMCGDFLADIHFDVVKRMVSLFYLFHSLFFKKKSLHIFQGLMLE
jgi:hypothetical protein